MAMVSRRPSPDTAMRALGASEPPGAGFSGPGPAPARTFRVVEVVSGAVLANGADTRTTIDLLTRIDSIFDVTVFVWHPAARAWRQLTVGEQRTLWNFRGR